MQKQIIAERLANLVAAMANCQKNGNMEWYSRHHDKAVAMANEYMPRGSGFDAGTVFQIEKSTPDNLIFTTSFHHMDQHGGYDGWTEHTIRVKPSFIGRFDLTVSGRNRNGIKEYIAETFHHVFVD